MAKKTIESPAPNPEAPADRAQRLVKIDHEAERLAYLATLDPRQREMLDPPGAE